MRHRLALAAPLLGLCLAPPATADEGRTGGIVPAAADGRPLNLGFESGTLDDWTAEGNAFQGQPIRGDAVRGRRPDMSSRHDGEYWVGSFERHGDQAKGTLTSAPFKVSHPYASFLIGGGSRAGLAAQILRADDGKVIFEAGGEDAEDMKPVAVDLRPHLNREIRIRLVDQDTDGWGHINFDDFRFHDAMPKVPARLARDNFSHEGLAPEKAAAAMTPRPGFRVTLAAAEPEILQPIAMAYDDRGRLWVAEAYSYPIRVPQEEARDRILIFEDKDGDGAFDGRKVFADKLNLVSAIEIGFGGVWVGSAPHLLFIPDRDGDDRPDGAPEILLDGWGYQDTHETLNTFTWGPDGWLYGCHGVFTHSRVGKPGTPDDKRVPINAGIWRYHPTRHTFEVFIEGTSNPWGVDFDKHGQAFITACVIPHLYHLIPGGRYQRQAGQHFNPFTYDDIKTIGDHVHYLGANPHGGNGKSDQAGGGHAHCGAMIYQGGKWPAEYAGALFMNNIHGARINEDVLEPSGSGYVGRHRPDFLLANDSWSQIINLRYGPDGDIHFIDWYDRQQCHRTEVDVHDRGNGRIFKVTYGEPEKVEVDLKAKGDRELVDLLRSPNDWYVRHARRLLQERGLKPEVREAVAAIAFGRDEVPQRLRGLWALHTASGLNTEEILKALGDASPHVRGWGARIAAEGGDPAPAVLERMVELAAKDDSPVVRLELASAAGRLAKDRRWDLLAALSRRSEDAGDHNVPLMIWYAAEPLVDLDPKRALAMAEASTVPPLRPFVARKLATGGKPEALALLVGALGRADRDEVRLDLLREINVALQGRRRAEMPAGWAEVFPKLARGSDAVRNEATTLALTFGDAKAVGILTGLALDRDADAGQRRGALAALVKVRPEGLLGTLSSLLADPALRPQALRGLAAIDDPKIPDLILKAYPGLTPAERKDALGTLATRPAWAKVLFNAIAKEKVARTDLSADVIRQARNLKDDEVDRLIAEVWGAVRESPAEKSALIQRYRALLTDPEAPKGDAEYGRAVFAKVCQQCHTLFGTGAAVGPELTGSNRADVEYVLANVLDPDALIGKDYQAQVLMLDDGRVLTGIVKAETADAVTLVTANETVVVPAGEIEERKVSPGSMMPSDLWNNLKDHDVRALVAYLASPAQVPLLATPESNPGLFNGRDLAGWRGEPEIWKVEGQEIVGESKGEEAEALVSDVTAGDFRLSFEVKGEGDAAFAFRSALKEGEYDTGIALRVGPGDKAPAGGGGSNPAASGPAPLKAGEWHKVEIEAKGLAFKVAIDGKPDAEAKVAEPLRRGVFALLLPKGEAASIRVRNLRFEPL